VSETSNNACEPGEQFIMQYLLKIAMRDLITIRLSNKCWEKMYSFAINF